MVERCQKKNREMGQAMVEWAFVFPVFLLLLCAIMDFSWIGYQRLMFESSFQMAAWDFSLNLQLPGGGELTDKDILEETTPPNYDMSSPNVVKVSGRDYTLGEGIKKHMLQSAAGFLKEDELTVTSASAVFQIVPVKDAYQTAGSEKLEIWSYELRVALEGDLEYRVKLLTPISRAFIHSDEVVFTKKLIRERTERVAVKRRVAIPVPP